MSDQTVTWNVMDCLAAKKEFDFSGLILNLKFIQILIDGIVVVVLLMKVSFEGPHPVELQPLDDSSN